jgi:hypothetical protein
MKITRRQLKRIIQEEVQATRLDESPTKEEQIRADLAELAEHYQLIELTRTATTAMDKVLEKMSAMGMSGYFYGDVNDMRDDMARILGDPTTGTVEDLIAGLVHNLGVPEQKAKRGMPAPVERNTGSE